MSQMSQMAPSTIESPLQQNSIKSKTISMNDNTIKCDKSLPSQDSSALFLQQGIEFVWIDEDDGDDLEVDDTLDGEVAAAGDESFSFIQSSSPSVLSQPDEIVKDKAHALARRSLDMLSTRNQTSQDSTSSQESIDLTDTSTIQISDRGSPKPVHRKIKKRPVNPENPDINDYMTDEEFNSHLKALSLLSQTENTRQSKRPCLERPSQGCKELPHTVAGVGINNLRPGKTVELVDGTFLRIHKIWADLNGSVMLSGKHLLRQSSLAPKMPKCKGELIWTVEAYTRNFKHREVFREITIKVDKVVRLRKVVFTNATYPQVSRNDPSEPKGDGPQTLYCRWKLTVVDRDREFMTETSIQRLEYAESDRSFGIPIDALRAQWRGATELGGSFKTARAPTLIYLEHEDEPTAVNDSNFDTAGRKYTVGDCFCGCGGVSRGAKQAGLHVEWGFDIDEAAMNSYRANFEKHGTLCLCKDVGHFLLHARGKRYRVDILHASPPCQPYSAAHTTSQNIQRDEANQAVLFSTHQLIEFVKPRIISMEETEGLYARHPQYFFSLVHTFVQLGYSVRWAVINTFPYGIPQTRRRVYIFAAGPGETLPAFPTPTHGTAPDLRPYETIASAISRIPRNATHHDTTSGHFKSGPKPPFNPHRPAHTLTCGGGEHNYHPKGQRTYTVREMACLQTFPMHHSFADNNKTAAKKQIGNAVPPRLAKVFFKACVQSLRENDEKEMMAHGAAVDTTPMSTTATASSSTTSFFSFSSASSSPRATPNDSSNSLSRAENTSDSDFTFRSPLQTTFSVGTSSRSSSRSGSSDDDYIMID